MTLCSCEDRDPSTLGKMISKKPNVFLGPLMSLVKGYHLPAVWSSWSAKISLWCIDPDHYREGPTYILFSEPRVVFLVFSYGADHKPFDTPTKVAVQLAT